MIKPVLKFINSIPFPLTIKHYQTFGGQTSSLKDSKLDSSQSWDVLRVAHPQFSISENREEWLKAADAQLKKDGQDGGLIKRAQDLDIILRNEHIQRIFSVGVGGAGLEYQLKKVHPELELICSEYARKNVEILRKVFFEADEVIEFDILHGKWEEVSMEYLKGNSTVLMYRVDASFNDEEWRNIFKKMYAANINKIIFIPSSFLTILSIFNRKKREYKWKRGHDDVVFSGYLRTKSRFKSYWRGLYAHKPHDFGGIKGFVLTRG